MTTRIADRASGVLQGAADATMGVKHEIRARGSEQTPSGDREGAVYARWQAGLPARNAVERDGYAAIEANLTAGMNHLNWLSKQASEMDAAVQQAGRGGFEAGS